jgi:hypothetical protein
MSAFPLHEVKSDRSRDSDSRKEQAAGLGGGEVGLHEPHVPAGRRRAMRSEIRVDEAELKVCHQYEFRQADDGDAGHEVAARRRIPRRLAGERAAPVDEREQVGVGGNGRHE